MAVPEPDGDVGKLPKWAQQHIEFLTQQVHEQEKHIAMLSGDAEDARVVIRYSGDRPDQAVSDGTSRAVTFKLTDRHSGEVYVRIDDEGDKPFLSITGSTGFAVHPRAGNSVEVHPLK